MAKTKVFVSFDYDHDETLKEFLVGQSKLKDSPFDLADWSIKEPQTGTGKRRRESASKVLTSLLSFAAYTLTPQRE